MGHRLLKLFYLRQFLTKRSNLILKFKRTFFIIHCTIRSLFCSIIYRIHLMP